MASFKRSLAPFASLMIILSVAGCDGPGEQAGRAADKAAAAARGEAVSGEGPNELIGEAHDRVERAERKAQDARADVLEQRADELRREADAQAAKLDQQADDVRAAPPSQ